jgi:hypothetical protein
MASIASILGVTRSRGYENSTGSVDARGIPAKSCSIFVEGGSQMDISQTIGLKTPPGSQTNGSITYTYVDSRGSTKVVNFDRPTNAVIHVDLTLKALTGWATSIQPIIAQAIASYLNTLGIGDSVRYFDVSVPAKILGSPYASAFSLSAMQIKKNAGSFVTADLALAYNEVPFGNVANVTFTVI